MIKIWKPRDISRKILNICKTMEHLMGSHNKDGIPSMLHISWPGESDIWHDGDDLMYVTFTHHIDTTEEVQLDFHTRYTPVPWSAFPMLINIFKDHFKDSEDKERDKSSPRCRTVSEKVMKGIHQTVPFLFYWGDWGEDDDLNVHCCPIENWNDIMHFNTDVLSDIIDRAYRNYCECDFHIGIHDQEGLEIISDFDSINDWKKYILRHYESLEDRGYIPVCIQVSQDDDDDDADIIYWFSKPEYKDGDDEED